MLINEFWEILSSYLEDDSIKNLIFYCNIGKIEIRSDSFGYDYWESEYDTEKKKLLTSNILSQKNKQIIVLENIFFTKAPIAVIDGPRDELVHHTYSSSKLKKIAMDVNKIYSIAYN